MEIPNLKTRREEIKKREENGEELFTIMLDGMFGNLRNMPEYNDSDEVYRKANEDIKRMDFSEMSTYIDSMSQIADYWKEKAEHYLDYVDKTKYILDDDGYLEEFN